KKKYLLLFILCLSFNFSEVHRKQNNNQPNHSLQPTPWVARFGSDGPCMSYLKSEPSRMWGGSPPRTHVAFLTGWLIPELANNVYAELSL
ncbi:MAG: hypothetical protein KAS19_11760, partial [Anaerolineales bacterium]|nr:hypothetical protein [Anaerolineales bacterium]